MLVLSRNEQESIEIQTSDGVIRIAISKIFGTRVAVAIDAPKQCNILRSELKFQPPKLHCDRPFVASKATVLRGGM